MTAQLDSDNPEPRVPDLAPEPLAVSYEPLAPVAEARDTLRPSAEVLHDLAVVTDAIVRVTTEDWIEEPST